jgi:hypothetical protein
MVAQNESPITGAVLLYQSPEPLDLNRHAKLGLRRTPTPFGFAAKQHFIPINILEFGPTSISYPIIFAGETYTPLAVMGLKDGENIYLDAEGGYRVGYYIPAYLRRYPFVGAIDNAQQRVVICVDRASDLLTEDAPDFPLFENGETTAVTKAYVEMCGQFDADRTRTESFVALLRDMDLFESKQTTYTPRNADGSAGEAVLISEYFAVSETKLRELPAEKLIQLRDTGALSQIYAHLHSLFAWERLITESLARANSALDTVAGNA